MLPVWQLFHSKLPAIVLYPFIQFFIWNCRFLHSNSVQNLVLAWSVSESCTGARGCRWLKEIALWKPIIHSLNFYHLWCMKEKPTLCVGWLVRAEAGVKSVCDQVGMTMMTNRFVTTKGKKKEKSSCKIEIIVLADGWKFCIPPL